MQLTYDTASGWWFCVCVLEVLMGYDPVRTVRHLQRQHNSAGFCFLIQAHYISFLFAPGTDESAGTGVGGVIIESIILGQIGYMR